MACCSCLALKDTPRDLYDDHHDYNRAHGRGRRLVAPFTRK
jgi:hypothetical protein